MENVKRILLAVGEFFVGFILVALIVLAVCDMSLRIQRNNHVSTPNLFGFVIAEVTTDELEPYVKQGEILIVQKGGEIRIGDIVAYVKNNQCDVKRVENITPLLTADGSGNITVEPSEVYGKKLASFGSFSGFVGFLQSTVGTSITLALAIIIAFSPLIFSKRTRNDLD
jgi:hypothetical protein